MKYTIALVLFTFLVLNVHAEGSELFLKLKQISEKCKTDLNSPQDAVAILATRNIPTTEEQRIKDGKLNRDVIETVGRQRFGDDQQKLEILQSLYTDCEPKVVADPAEKCSLGRKLRECFVKNPHAADLQIRTELVNSPNLEYRLIAAASKNHDELDLFRCHHLSQTISNLSKF